MKQLGESIKSLREDKDMTQEELGNLLDVSRQAISSWESDINEPNIACLKRLADIFGVSIDLLLNYDIKLNQTVVIDDDTKYIIEMVNKDPRLKKFIVKTIKELTKLL